MMSTLLPPERPLVIDVTLRDGGYLNQWDFAPQHLARAVALGVQADADLIEVGYVDDSPGLPTASACPPEWLQALRQQFPELRLAGMIRPNVPEPEQVLSRRQGLLALLRIPVDLRWPEKAFALGEKCQAYGFAVSFNLTGVSCFELSQIQAAAAAVPAFAKVVYLADSRGALRVTDIAPLLACVREVWSGELGYHAHNSLGLARDNTLAALEAGCQWIDGSLDGVGLGGRNLHLAEALALAQRVRQDLKPDPSTLQVSATELGLDVLTAAETPLYVLCAERNLRMEWVASLIQAFGLTRSAAILASLPQRNWFEVQELEAFMEPADWQQLRW